MKAQKPMNLLALSLALTVLGFGCLNSARRGPAGSSSTPKVLVSAPLNEASFTITNMTLAASSGGSGQDAVISFSAASSAPTITSYCAANTESGANSCFCSFSWSEVNPNNGTAYAVPRTAYSVLADPVQAYNVRCKLPSVWTTEIPDTTVVKVKVIAGPGNDTSLLMSPYDYTKGGTPTNADFTDADGRGFYNIHRYTCYTRNDVNLGIASKFSPESMRIGFTDAFNPDGEQIKIGFPLGTEFCIGGRDVPEAPNQPDRKCISVPAVGPSAKSFYLNLYMQSALRGSFVGQNAGYVCARVKEALNSTGLPPAQIGSQGAPWPMDRTFALAISSSTEFSVPVEAPSVLGITGDTVTRPTSCTNPNEEGTGDSSQISSKCLGWAKPPTSDGRCGSFKDATGATRLTYRLRKYVAYYPRDYNALGVPNKSIVADRVYVVDRPLQSPDPLAPYTMLGPKPCPFSYFDHTGVSGQGSSLSRSAYYPALPEVRTCIGGADASCPVGVFSRLDGTGSCLAGQTCFKGFCKYGDPGCAGSLSPVALNSGGTACAAGQNCVTGSSRPDALEGGGICFRKSATDPNCLSFFPELVHPAQTTTGGGIPANSFVYADGDGTCEVGEWCFVLTKSTGGVCRSNLDTDCHAAGTPGYVGTNNACWTGKNADNVYLPNFDSGNPRNSCSATLPFVVYDATNTPTAVSLSTTHRFNPATFNIGGGRTIAMSKVYHRPIEAWTPHYVEDESFQACAPLATPFTDPPLHFAKDTSGNVSYCASVYPTQNDSVAELDKRPNAALGEAAPGWVVPFTSPVVKNSSSQSCTFTPLTLPTNYPATETCNAAGLAIAGYQELASTNCDSRGSLDLRQYCRAPARHPADLYWDIKPVSPVPANYSPNSTNFFGSNKTCDRTVINPNDGSWRKFPLQAPPSDIESALRGSPSYNCTVTYDAGLGKTGKFTPSGGCCARTAVPGPTVAGKSLSTTMYTNSTPGHVTNDTAHLEPDVACGVPTY